MKLTPALPNKKESVLVIGISVVFFTLTAIFVGLRPEHGMIIGLFGVLFFTTVETRKLAVALLPFIVFGMSYDWMRVYPNYMVNPIDVEGLYNLEKKLFGIVENGVRMIPCEYFAIHNNPILDFLSGLFYLTWVPVPVGFGIYLYLKNEKKLFLHFALVFLFVNLIGFSIYYIHPAAPPWYAMNYGFEAILDTPGNMGGLARFDALIGIPVFDSIYGRNANVFAAVPSLHSAYLVVVLYYALKRRSHWLLSLVVGIFLVGIWFTAVYTSHHYVIDVILGVLCAIAGIVIFEYGLMKLKCFKRFMRNYYEYIK